MRRAVFVMSALVIVGLALLPQRSAVTARELDVLSTPIAEGNDCIDCSEICSSGYHDAWDNGYDEWFRNGGAHSLDDRCKSGSCDTKHGPYPCGIEGLMSSVELESLRISMAQGDVVAISKLMMRHRQISLNVSRSAIQVAGCRGAIIAHIPVAGGTVADLKRATSVGPSD